MKKNKIIVSGIQPTAKTLHLGNYLGAVKNWVNLQNENKYYCIYFIADLHSLTSRINRNELKENTLNLILQLLACGINPKKSLIFIQSYNKYHTYLSWIFSCLTPIGELFRMHQFKEKSKGLRKKANAGLFTYPILQSADILIYKAIGVPVGEDQSQHIELSRMIARKFNNYYKVNLFPLPKGIYTKVPKIYSLSDPSKKMSKSLGERHYIALDEDIESIKKKIKSAVTDSGPQKRMSKSVKNLFNILREFDNDSYLELLEEYKKRTLKYVYLKEKLIEALLKFIIPFQERLKEFKNSKSEVIDIIIDGNKKAEELAYKTISQVEEVVFSKDLSF